MKKATLTFMLAACVLWMPFAAADDAADDDADAVKAFMGKWEVEMKFNERTINSKLTITKSEEGKLGGTWESQRGKSKLKDVSVKKGELTFARTMNRQGTEFTINSKSKIKDGKLVGAMTTRRGDRPFTAVRPKAEETGHGGDGTAGPGHGGDGTAGAGHGGGGVAAMLQRMDADGDGKIQESEAPGQMKQFFGMIDSNGDGSLDEAELEAMMEFRRQQQGN